MKGFQFRKSVKVLPGVRFNISKSGVSLSLGPKGAHITTGPRGTELHLDLPGSGAYYRRKIDLSGGEKKADKSETDQHAEALNVGPVQRLTTPANELELVDALRELQAGNEDEATTTPNRAHLVEEQRPAGSRSLGRRSKVVAPNREYSDIL